jgi:hypothetical protein
MIKQNERTSDIKLSSGRTVTHVQLANAEEAVVLNDETSQLTSEEWEEYCQKVLNQLYKQGA